MIGHRLKRNSVVALSLGSAMMLSALTIAQNGESDSHAVASSRTETGDSGIEVQDCVVRFSKEVRIPVLSSGAVAKVMVARNDIVQSDSPLVRLDDRQALIAERVASKRLAMAREAARDDLEIRYATLALRHAEEELGTSRSIQNDVRGAIPLRQVRLLQLAVQRAEVELEKAQKDQARRADEVELREAELAKSKHDMASLSVTSPVDGVVLDVSRQPAEWINKGETIVTVGCMDRLHVHALVESAKIPSGRCVGLPVRVEWIDPATGRPMALRGKVLSVDPQVLPGGRYRLHAEIENRTQAGAMSQWVLHPGAEVRMQVFPTAVTAMKRPRGYR